jgi:G:T/U mismatch-specific DNA glycosylase
MEQKIETRPFPPFLPKKATVMMMGTFPPAAEKRAMEFHYPNFQNDMWRVYGLIFFNDKDHFRKGDEKAFDPEKIKAFLDQKGIASCPTVYKAIRGHGNASDAFLEVVEPVNLKDVLGQVPDVAHICTTGGKATEILLGLLPEKVKLPKTNETINFVYDGRELSLTRLPSTSRAYPLSLVKKAEAYRDFFKNCGLIAD